MRIWNKEHRLIRIEEMNPKRDQWNKLLNYGKFRNALFDIILKRMLMTDDEIISKMKGLTIQRGLV